MKCAKLNVVVAYRDERSEGPNGLRKRLTDVSIRLGEDVVAIRTIPGQWSQKAALTEFRRFPSRFTAQGPISVNLDALATIAVAA